MGRFEPTGPVDVPGLEHSVVNLSWGVLRGACGPSDGTAGAGSNVPSALGVLRHSEIYREYPQEIEEAFAVLEQHVIKEGQLFPVALATLPFLFATLRPRVKDPNGPASWPARSAEPISERIADLIALYASASKTLEAPLGDHLLQIIGDHSADIVRWWGHYDRALAALAVHVPALRTLYLAAIEGAERVEPEVLLALIELGEAPGETTEFAFAMLDGADSTDLQRVAAAAFLARFGEHSPEQLMRIDAALPPTARGTLRKHVRFWDPNLSRPVVAPKLYEAEVLFTGKKLVVVKAGNRSVTLPWEGAEVAKGDRLQVGLTTHGQPKLAVVTDWKGNVRVIDF
ncbi:MAG TPA: hypothetical protein VIV11_40120 [Kofleriaceae bacterium]